MFVQKKLVDDIFNIVFGDETIYLLKYNFNINGMRGKKHLKSSFRSVVSYFYIIAHILCILINFLFRFFLIFCHEI